MSQAGYIDDLRAQLAAALEAQRLLGFDVQELREALESRSSDLELALKAKDKAERLVAQLLRAQKTSDKVHRDMVAKAEQELASALRGAVQERKWREAAEQERDEAQRLLGILRESLAYEQSHKTDLADIASAAYQRSLSRLQEELDKAEQERAEANDEIGRRGIMLDAAEARTEALEAAMEEITRLGSISSHAHVAGEALRIATAALHEISRGHHYASCRGGACDCFQVEAQRAVDQIELTPEPSTFAP